MLATNNEYSVRNYVGCSCLASALKSHLRHMAEEQDGCKLFSNPQQGGLWDSVLTTVP